MSELGHLISATISKKEFLDLNGEVLLRNNALDRLLEVKMNTETVIRFVDERVVLVDARKYIWVERGWGG